jgi:mRNA-degrading endonuclease toxin of MazEF toxin-antitoxin module
MSSNPPTQNWYPQRGKVYLVQLDKLRPAIVLSVDSINRHARDVCVVGTTTVEHQRFSMRVPIQAGDGGFDSDCWAKCDQVTTLEKSRLQQNPIGTLSLEKFKMIEEQVRICLGLRVT